MVARTTRWHAKHEARAEQLPLLLRLGVLTLLRAMFCALQGPTPPSHSSPNAFMPPGAVRIWAMLLHPKKLPAHAIVWKMATSANTHRERVTGMPPAR